jgi:hypothetical protein
MSYLTKLESLSSHQFRKLYQSLNCILLLRDQHAKSTAQDLWEWAELCITGRYKVITLVYKETAVLGDVMSVTLVKWTGFQQNHYENRGSRSSITLVNTLPIIWCHTPEDSTRQRVTIHTLPSWCSSYIPKGLVQVEFSASWTWVHIGATINVYTRQVGWNPYSNTLEPK